MIGMTVGLPTERHGWQSACGPPEESPNPLPGAASGLLKGYLGKIILTVHIVLVDILPRIILKNFIKKCKNPEYVQMIILKISNTKFRK